VALKASDFLAGKSAERHEVETPAGVLVVYVKPMTWIQQQEAISKFVDFVIEGEDMKPRIDFGGYWQYVLRNCITDTEPKIEKKDLMNLSPEVGASLVEVLPGIDSLIATMTGGEPRPLE
tara:strand:- start:2911 stop:3270 length:360 start_codon:yes stop_codon:yes gene_type:complete